MTDRELLAAERARGAEAAKALIEHLQAMGASHLEMPIAHEGREYVVTVTDIGLI